MYGTPPFECGRVRPEHLAQDTLRSLFARVARETYQELYQVADLLEPADTGFVRHMLHCPDTLQPAFIPFYEAYEAKLRLARASKSSPPQVNPEGQVRKG